MIGNDGLGKGLADSIDLRSVTTTLDTDADINVGEALLAQDEDRLKDLQAEDLGLDQLQGNTINTNQTLASLAMSDGSGGFLERTDTFKNDNRHHYHTLRP